MGGARAEYESRGARRAEQLAAAQGAEARISNLRLAVFVAGLALVFAAWLVGLHAAWVVVPAVAFVVLVVLHERASRRATAARRAHAYYEAGLRRLDDEWMGQGITRTDLAPDDHPYAADLDLFGVGSVFDRVCAARTGAGVRMLADWLLAPAEPAVIEQRQRAIEDLRERLQLREDLALAGTELQAEIEPEYLQQWGERPAVLSASAVGTARAVAWAMTVLNLGAAVAWAAGLSGPLPLMLTLLATWIAHRPYAGLAKRVAVGVERPSRELSVVAAVLRRLESERFDAPRLQSLQAELSTGDGSASAAIARLVRLVEWLDAQRSAVFAPIAFATMWGVQFGLAIEAWRARHGGRIAGWFSALGELEALASLSAYAYERPEDPFPEIVEGAPRVEGEAVGHPLLPARTRVCNPVALGPDRRALVISGSNMSGKSTYLRTVGLNVVLALAGAPVCAERFALTPLRVGATLRVQDSLQGGASRFFAEITRLRRVVDVAEAGPGALFLLDEILHGTNSHDRRIGAIAVVASLLQRDAIGLVTTHDLALATAADELPGEVDNVHFADELRDGELVFDYRLKPGTVQTSNALDLMRAVGLSV